MQIDQRTLKRLLTLDDTHLTELIRTVAAEAGIDPAQLGLSPDNVSTLRTALSSVTEEDLSRLNEVYAEYRDSRREGAREDRHE